MNLAVGLFQFSLILHISHRGRNKRSGTLIVEWCVIFSWMCFAGNICSQLHKWEFWGAKTPLIKGFSGIAAVLFYSYIFAAKKVGIYFWKWPTPRDLGELILKDPAFSGFQEMDYIGKMWSITVVKGVRSVTRVTVSADCSPLG